jgi:hypothetical protein
MPVGALTAVILAFNALSAQTMGYRGRAWSLPQRLPAAAYAPLNEWIAANTAPEEVIASGLDPFVHWQTGRVSVPSWRFSPDDYGRFDTTRVTLAAQFDSIVELTGARYAALVLWDNKAAATLKAWAELNPDRAEKVFESGSEGSPGVVYRLTPPTSR